MYILTTDMSKDFDSLCHSLIVKKLEAYGLGQNSLNLFRSYFDNRLNRVKIKDATSDWKRILLGCRKARLSVPFCGIFSKMTCHTI